MLNKTIAEQLLETSLFLELEADNPFRIRAFRRAAEIVESLSADLNNLSRDQILEIEGIGKGIAEFIDQVKARGVGSELARLKNKYPKDFLTLLNMPGLGPKRAAVLLKEIGVDSLDKLAQAAQTHKIAGLHGFGEKIQEKILKNLAMVKESTQRVLLAEARLMASQIMNYLQFCPFIDQLQVAGSLRRWKETVGDLDFLCTSETPEKAIKHFTANSEVREILSAGQTKASVLLKSGMQCDFRVVPENSMGAALLYFTGSKEHNVRLREWAQKRGMTLNEYGLFDLKDKKKKKPLASRTEEEIYARLGLQAIPPELREDRGEIEAASHRHIPRLIEENDILGDAHNHTNLSDGIDTIEGMIETAVTKNWKWYFCGDHSPYLKISSGLSISELKSKMALIRQLDQRQKNMRVGLGAEVDLLHNGTLDYPDEILDEIDCVVASVHSRFSQTEPEMTGRICKALEHRRVHILGHITGRLIYKREGYKINFDQVLEKAAQTQTAIEINGQPDRQELEDFHVKRAIQMGIPLILSTDAHSKQQLDNMTNALHVARRGWAEPKHLLNCLEYEEFKKWLNT